MNQTSKTARTAAALDYLHSRFPAAFATDPATVHPLAVGIREALRAAIEADPAADPSACEWALRRWCLSRAYTAALAVGRPRVDLEGHLAGAVTPEHQAAAVARLATEHERTAARATRREKAQRVQAAQKAKRKQQAKPAPVPVPAAPRSSTTNERTAARPVITIKRRRPSAPE